MTKAKGLSTRLIHEAEGAVADASPLVTPIYETTTFLFSSAAEVQAYAEGRSSKFLYTRYENPTLTAVEAKLAAVEGAEAALVLSSGMAATATTLFALLEAGDEVVCSTAVYGGTLHLIQDVLRRFGVRARFVEPASLSDPAAAFTEQTRVLWFESPVNPTLRCVDIAACAKACRSRQVISIMDNTFATPINQQPIALGVDLVMHSGTKYLNGHSDVMAGAVMGPRVLIDRVARARRLFGSVLDPAAGDRLSRGLKTLPVRVARHNQSAQRVAEFLASDRRVTRAYYPGLSRDPDHAIANRQMCGFGGMVTFEVDDGLEGAARVFDRLRVFQRAASLGGVESLCSLPVLTSHFGYTDEQLVQAGVTKGMLRLSVGLEDVDDLIADVDEALG